MPFAAPAAGVADPIGPEQWFKSLPFVTRYWFGATMVITLCANFQIISPLQVVFFWDKITSNFELWRILTCFCYAGAFEFGTMIKCYLLVQFSRQYESGGPFNTGAGGGTADYAFCIMFGMVAILISYCLLPLPLVPLFSENMIYYVLYIWSKRNPTAPANLWGVPLQANYLPFACLAMTVFMGGHYMGMIHGMAVGHVYYFLVDVVPIVQGKDILRTPQFLIDYFGIGEYNPAQIPVERPVRAPAGDGGGGGGGGYNWGGGGRPLGGN